MKARAIIESNEMFASKHQEGAVCVFIGATSGIGWGTLRRMATMLYSSTFYVLGRSEARFASKLDQLRDLGPTSKFVFVDTQISFISGIDTACERIISTEKRVDYLCMSSGGMPFGGAICMS